MPSEKNEDRALIFSGSIAYQMTNMMWYESKVAIDQKFPKKNQNWKKEKNESIFVLF